MSDRVRVLVVDDSAFARKVMREVVAASPRFEVVGIARDGLEALEKIHELQPDVITLDLVMPNLDGLGLLRALPSKGAPRVVVVSISGQESDLVVEALQLGAVAVVQKPTALATERLYELGAELREKLLEAAGSRVSLAPPPASPLPAPRAHGAVELVVVGASTGGPQALTRLLTALPGDLPVPLALVLHIPPGYTEAFAKRLDAVCALEVREAEEGMPLVPGRAVVARAGEHLLVERAGSELVCRLSSTPAGTPHRPAVDVLFASAERACGHRVLAVVLTGMGEDGLAGARKIKASGGRVLAEAESSCVVYGMPRAVTEAGLVAEQAPVDEMARAILRHL